MIVKRKHGFFVLSEKTKRNLGGPYKTREEALKRLRQVEFFKHLKGNKGQAVIIFVLLIILVIGAGIYVGRQYFIQRTQPSPVSSTPSLSPTPLPPSTFQELLTRNCKVIRDTFGTITVDELPVRIDATILKEILSKQNAVACESVGNPYTWYVNIGSSVLLYDNYSKELGHGGYSYFRKPEPHEIIKKTNDATVAIWLNSGEGPNLVGSTWIVAEGIKRFEFSNGQVFYTNFGDTVIDFDNPRLIALLKQYSQQVEDSDYLEITKPGVEQAIIKQFFSNLEQVDTPEKELIATIERVLSGISLK